MHNPSKSGARPEKPASGALANANAQIAALEQELALKSEQLALARREITNVQQRRIDEERLKVLLQMAGATAAELDEPLGELLRACAELEIDPVGAGRLGKRVEALKASALRVERCIEQIQSAQSSLLAPLPRDLDPETPQGHYRVLLIECEDHFSSTLHAWLAPWSEVVELKRVRNCGQAERRLAREAFDLILSDYELPDGNSLDLFTRLSTRMNLPPFILISGQGSEDVVAQAVRRGACDYLPKAGLNRERVVQSILAALERVRLRQELEAAHRRLADLATHDELTGLYNRRYLMEALETEISRAHRYGQPLTLCMFDLDHFKDLNDQFGHEAGDRVLVSIADMLHQTVRSPDVAGRYGGEEFLVLLINTGVEKAAHYGDRLRRQVGRKRFRFGGQARVRITCSIGLAACHPDADRAPDLVNRADAALYDAKGSGRNRVRIAR
ncbi:MAG: diguanylate cyclase [Candidatus Hydrogenedentes bacterium]|nr:diguanylate cyclase [Candidatus Hydrogenedentota bacterium]